MTDSQIATTKCFSGILRQLLCTGSLPTHPSDHITEPNTINLTTESKKTEFDPPNKDPKTPAKVEAPATTPGIVARLMGLESLPVPKLRTLDSIARSRSVNSIDYLIEFDPFQVQHRRVRTSASFREFPTCLRQQNHDLFVFYLENVDETKEMGSKLRKNEVGFGEVKQRKAVERSKNKENVRERVVVKKKENVENKKKGSSKGKDEIRSVYGKHCSEVGDCSGAKDLGFVLPHKNDVYRKPRASLKAKSSLKPINRKEVSVRSKFTTTKKSQQEVKKVELGCSSEYSSPASVLDLQDFSIHPKSRSSGDSRAKVSNSKRKSSPRIANYDYPSPQITRTSKTTDGLELGAIKNKDYGQSMKSRESEYYSQQLGEICRLTEKDIKEPNWLAKEVCRLEDFEEICMEFGQHILDILLHQVVDELAAFHMTCKF